jgi:hypothetical protein
LGIERRDDCARGASRDQTCTRTDRRAAAATCSSTENSAEARPQQGCSNAFLYGSVDLP